MPAAAATRSKTSTQQRAARNARALERARNGHGSGAAARPAPATPRRKSGPAAPRKAAPKRAPRVVAQPPSVARIAHGSAAMLLDRLLRGRAWVVLVGALLAGIVFLNVSVLELNRGIARTDVQAASLERANSVLRSRVAGLGNPERIQQLAEARGFVLPLPGDYTYLRKTATPDARLAASRITAPAGPQTSTTASSSTTTSSTGSTSSTSSTPSSSTTSPSTTTPSSTTPSTTTPSTTAGSTTAPSATGTTAPTTTPVP